MAKLRDEVKRLTPKQKAALHSIGARFLLPMGAGGALVYLILELLLLIE